MFQLPRSHTDLENLMQERFYQNKPMAKSAVDKLYPVSSADNDLIHLKKQKTNIFLLNLLLNVWHKEKVEIKEGFYNNEYIIKELSQWITFDSSSYEEVELKTLNYLQPTEANTDNKEKPIEATHTQKPSDELTISFDMNTVKKINSLLSKGALNKNDEK